MEGNTVRPDMHEVVIERPRRRGTLRHHNVRARYKGMDIETLDDLPKKQGYRRPYVESWGDAKEFSDLLGPLHRFLISKVGQKWDDVYSEIRETLNPDSTVQIHIMGHVFQFVEINTRIDENGEIYVLGRYSRYNIYGGQLYVHPETGILCLSPKTSRRMTAEYHAAVKHLQSIFGKDWYDIVRWNKTYQPHWNGTKVEAEAKNHVRVGHEQELHKMDGIWYWAVFSDVPPPLTMSWFEGGERRQKIVRQGASDYWTGRAHTEGRYRSGRRQASRRDLRRYNLANDA
jgi:hypothetical protein